MDNDMLIIVLEFEVVVFYVKYFFLERNVDGKKGDVF